MNPTVLEQMRHVIAETKDQLVSRFRTVYLDTSGSKFSNNPQATCEHVASQLLDWIEQEIEEKILSAPRTTFDGLDTTFVAGRAQAQQMAEVFETQGDYLPRNQVESDLTKIPPLPVIVVRNKSGEVLRLIRREREPSNRLDKKLTVWAGGHVRKEDAPGPVGAICRCGAGA